MNLHAATPASFCAESASPRHQRSAGRHDRPQTADGRSAQLENVGTVLGSPPVQMIMGRPKSASESRTRRHSSVVISFA
jgi:hypothetical protein